MAPVGQEIMHSPQLTQDESPIGLSESKPMVVRFPFPIRPMTLFPFTSLHARTHRSHRMQAEWLTAMEGLDVSVPLEYARGVKGDFTTPIFSASVSSSQSRVSAWRLQGCGWSASNSSTRVLRAASTLGSADLTAIPSAA